MSNGKHTPGPWQRESKHSTVIIADAPKGWKPTLQHPRYIVVQTHLYVSVPEEEIKANAALISAAPDLLEACKRALHWIPLADPDGEIIRQAISKAKERRKPKVAHCQVTGKPCGLLHDFELCICHGGPVEWKVEDK